jgi:cyclic pyranopterin phosphate synthase
MDEDMKFMSRRSALTIDELWDIAKAFISLGVNKIRITGGEPLIRPDLMTLVERLGLQALDDLSITTNGMRLSKLAHQLAAAGVQRVNISLDSLDHRKFKYITRNGDLSRVLNGIASAKSAGFRRIRINSVIMRNFNLDESVNLANFALNEGLDIAFIEEMPLGLVSSHNRTDELVVSELLKQHLQRVFRLRTSERTTAGPARYFDVDGYPGRIGFISPHSHNFCESCNRVRVDANGRLLLCLGQEHSLDLKRILRSSPVESRHEMLCNSITRGIAMKPLGHNFYGANEVQIVRFMSATGG